MEPIDIAQLNFVCGGYGPAQDPTHANADRRDAYKMDVERQRTNQGDGGYNRIQVLPAPGSGGNGGQ